MYFIKFFFICFLVGDYSKHWPNQLNAASLADHLHPLPFLGSLQVGFMCHVCQAHISPPGLILFWGREISQTRTRSLSPSFYGYGRGCSFSWSPTCRSSSSHYRPEFWQMTNMEYLYGLGGVGVLSIEYSYPTSLQCLWYHVDVSVVG